MTSEETTGGDPSKNRKVWWLVGAVIVVVALVVAIGLATGWGANSDGDSERGGRPTPLASDSSAATPDPSESEASNSEDGAPAPSEPRQTSAPVPLDGTAEPAAGIRVTLASITAIEGQASVPGEVDGPALQVTVNVENTNHEDALTDTLIVNVYYGPDRTPANILVKPRRDLPLSVAPRETAEGVYAFSVPADAHGQILVELDLSLDLPVILFEGAVA